MFFKRLEIVGFKSFGDKTIFEFEPGITAVVGPNGCGKSNVSDSIRWVLGEQSARALRGGRMEDVIFSGTDERSAINMAEVSFTLEDPDKVLPLGYHEVTVTRRVFRDGQSEYLVNKTPCRLKDIHELFMGTGIGTDAYSILEQGKMDLIVNAKPQDRRELFEEAAGITKFKSKKNEAMRKLESTEENLIRVNDIIKEVRRQIQSVQRYAAKARVHREAFSEMKGLHIAAARHRYEDISTAYAKLQEALAGVYEAQKEKARETEESHAQLASLRESQQKLLDAHDALRDEIAKLDAEIQRRDTQYRMDEERLAELTKAAGRWESEIQEHRQRADKMDQECREAAAELEQLAASCAAVKEEVSGRDEAVRQIQERIRALTQQQKERQERLLEEELGATRARNELAGLATSHKGVVVKRERLLAERAGMAAKYAELQAALEAAREAILSQHVKTAMLREECAVIEKICSEFEDKINFSKEQTDKLREDLARKKAELDLFNQWKAEGAGFQRSVQTMLAKRRQDPSAWSGLLGTVSDLLHVEPGYEAAAETALSALAEDLVVENGEWVEKVRAVLAGEKTGRISLWSKDAHAAVSDSDGRAVDDARVLGALSAFVKTDARLAGHVADLLAGTWVVRTWEDALALARENKVQGDIVTLHGECLHASGRMTFGLSSDLAQRVFGRETETRRLAVEIEAIKELLHDTIVDKGGFVVATEEHKAKGAGLAGSLREEEIRQATLQNELDKLLLQLEQSQSNQAMIAREIEEVGREEERFTNERVRHESLVADFERNQAVRKLELEGLAGELESQIKSREKLLEEVTHKKIQMVSLEEKLENRSAQRKSLAERLAELRQLCEVKESDAKDAVARMQQLQESVAQWKGVQEVLTGQKNQRQESLRELQGQKQEMAAQTGRLEKILADARVVLGQWTDKQRALEVERAQIVGQRDHLRENLMREFQVDLQSPEPVAEESAVSLEAFGGNWDAVEQHVAGLRKKLEGMGSVNISAMNEYDELQSRYDFLVKQHEDLVSAKQTLLKVISRINTTTRKLFAETFAQIRVNFQEIYTTLFGGGKADLLLTDENDILETGIEIVARPPGKKLQNISLLSGGEKALTAIALLFAVFQVKPSPFCVLDEIDAPLDESNITRFVEMLKEYAKKTQFIVITHNKRTISKADVLYGITMQESGISKVVSVRLTDNPQARADAAAMPQALRDRAQSPALFTPPSLESYPRGGASVETVESPAAETPERSGNE